MKFDEALKLACSKLDLDYNKIHRPGKPTVDGLRARELAKKLMKEKKPKKVKEKLAKRIAIPSTTPLHNCTFDVNLSKVPMKYFDQYIPKFLRRQWK